MATFKPFDGPLETLESQQGDDFHVTSITSFSEIREDDTKVLAIFKGLKVALKGSQAVNIVQQDQFDLVYSFTKAFTRLSPAVQQKFTKFIAECIGNIGLQLQGASSDSARLSEEYRDAVSMYVFFLSHIVRRGQDAANKAEQKKKTMDKHKSKQSKKGKAKTNSSPNKWKETCVLAMNSMSTTSEFNFGKLWPLGVPEEAFVDMFWKTGVYLLENCASAQKAGDLQDATIRLIGGAANKFPSIRPAIVAGLVQLMSNERTDNGSSKLPEPVGKLVLFMKKECNDKGLVADLLKEIGEMNLHEGAQDQKSLGQCCRNMGGFLICLSNDVPGLLLANLSYILPQMDRAAYPMRSGICEALGNLVMKLHQGVFTPPTEAPPAPAGEEQEAMVKDKASGRHSRDTLIQLLLERSRDKTSFSRSSVMKTWRAMVEAQAVPVDMYIPLARICTRHIMDNSSLVRKVALQLFSVMVRKNPFSPVLHPDFFDEQLSCLLEKLREKGVEVPDVLFEDVMEDDEEVAEPAAEKTEDAVEADAELTEETDMDAGEPSDDADKEQEAEAPAGIEAPVVDVAAELQDPEFQAALTQLRKSVKFAGILEQAVPKFVSLLKSQSNSDVIETLNVLKTCCPFRIKGFDGLQRKMLGLSFSRHDGIRNAAIETFQELSLNAPGSAGEAADAFTVANELTRLVSSSTMEEKQYFAEILRLLVKEKMINDEVIGTLWRFVCNSEEHTVINDIVLKAHNAMEVLHMMSVSKPVVVNNTENLKMLDTIVFGEASKRRRDYAFARHACAALESISASKMSEPSPGVMVLLEKIQDVIVGKWGFSNSQSQNKAWYAFAQQGLRAIFKQHAQPDKMSEAIVQQCAADIFGQEGGRASASQMSRFFFVLGEVAVDLLVHTETVSVAAKKLRLKAQEMQQDRAQEVAKKDGEEGQGIAAQCGLQSSEEDAEQDLYETIAEEEVIRKNLIGAFSGMVQAIVKRMLKDFQDGGVSANSTSIGRLFLNQSALMTLCKFMSVSRKFCKKNIAMIFDVLESMGSYEHAASMRANIVISLGDLLSRFPNVVAPQCHRLYACLQDTNISVRKNALMVISHLILNGMLKPSGYMAKIAICLEDKETRIGDLARLFFAELKKRDPKRNPIYNMLPDVISQLSSDYSVSSETFRSIIKFLLKHVDKDAQTENLVEKLCGRFQRSDSANDDKRSERLFCDFAYCLAQLPYGTKCIKKLMNCFEIYKVQMVIDEVHEHFTEMVEKALKHNANKDKTELKEEIVEFKRMVDRAHKGKFEDDLHDEEEKATSATADGEGETATPEATKVANDAPMQEEEDDEDSDSDSEIETMDVDEDEESSMDSSSEEEYSSEEDSSESEEEENVKPNKRGGKRAAAKKKPAAKKAATRRGRGKVRA